MRPFGGWVLGVAAPCCQFDIRGVCGNGRVAFGPVFDHGDVVGKAGLGRLVGVGYAFNQHAAVVFVIGECGFKLHPHHPCCVVPKGGGHCGQRGADEFAPDFFFCDVVDHTASTGQHPVVCQRQHGYGDEDAAADHGVGVYNVNPLVCPEMRGA